MSRRGQGGGIREVSETAVGPQRVDRLPPKRFSDRSRPTPSSKPPDRRPSVRRFPSTRGPCPRGRLCRPRVRSPRPARPARRPSTPRIPIRPNSSAPFRREVQELLAGRDSPNVERIRARCDEEPAVGAVCHRVAPGGLQSRDGSSREHLVHEQRIGYLPVLPSPGSSVAIDRASRLNVHVRKGAGDFGGASDCRPPIAARASSQRAG